MGNAFAALGRGLRDWGLFALIAMVVVLLWIVLTTALEGDEQNLGLTISFAPAIALYGVFLSIPGLTVHRWLVRRAERSGADSRKAAIAWSPFITLTGMWWIALQASDAGPVSAASLAALTLVTSLIYGALVPRREVAPALPPPP